MRNLLTLDACRRRDKEVFKLYGSYGDQTCGVFSLPCPKTGVFLQCIASSDGGWDHVSVSLPNRCPNWVEMNHVKRSFFAEDETAMQLHVPPAEHIDNHPWTLHLWRPNDGREIPRPPAAYV